MDERLRQDSELYAAAHWDHYFTIFLQRKLQTEIESDLKNAAEDGRSTSERILLQLRPKWVKEENGVWVGEIRLGDRPLRTVRQLAKNMIGFLDAIEELGWPTRIDDPVFPKSHFVNRYRTVYDLNENLKEIEFYCDGTNGGIRWRFRPLSDPSGHPQ
jgi:hypothetical protein